MSLSVLLSPAAANDQSEPQIKLKPHILLLLLLLKKRKTRKKEKQQQQQIQRRSTAFKLLRILENRWELGISLLYPLQITNAATYKKIDALLLSFFSLFFSLSVLLLTRNCTKNSPPS
jgi:hypothetical protein